MLLSVVIVNYNVKFYLAQCLWALQQTCGVASMEIIVVDNHSTAVWIFLNSASPTFVSSFVSTT